MLVNFFLTQFKVKVIIFTTILRFVSVKLGQVSQLLTIGFYLGRLRIYNLQIYGLQIYSLQIYSLRIYSLQICDLNNRGNLVRILVYRGIIVRILSYRSIVVYSVVHNLRVRYILASEVSSKAAQVYRINLVKWVRYKAGDPIKFRRSKEFFSSFNLVQDFLFSLFRLVLLLYCVI